MKKLLSIILAIATVVAFAPASEAQNSSALNKALKKEYKAKMKEYKKGGWFLYGNSRSLDVALLKHYEKLNAGNATEVVGVASSVVSKSNGHQVCINDACRTYAQSAGSHVKGRVTSDLGVEGSDAEAEFDHFYAAYERLVDKEIKGELIESYTIAHQIGKTDEGKPIYEMQTYFVVDIDKATQARIRAFENAAKESAAAQKYAKQVSDFINEGFEIESSK